MTIKYSFAVALLVLGMSGSARAECKILDQDQGALMVRYGAASSVCPFFKKQMSGIDLYVLFGLSNSISGIKEALKAQGSEYEACVNVVGPFVKARGDEWLAMDRQALCSSVKAELDAKPPLRSIFQKFGLLD